jgi:lysophospholipase L1-like esterase
MSTAWRRLRHLPFLVNAGFLLAALALLVLTLRGYSSPAPLRAVKATALGAVILGLLWLLGWAGGRLNAVVCAVLAGLLGLGQWRLSARRVESYPAGLTRKPAPYVMFTGAPRQLDHNELGYRGDLPAPEKPPDEYRVLIIGGSAVYGTGPARLTIPNHLQELAGRSGRSQVRFYNWGVVSQISAQELATVALRVRRYRPDLVVLYDGGNDMSAPFSYDPRPGYPFNFTLQESAVEVFQEGGLGVLAAGALTQSNLVRVLFGAELADAVARLPPVRNRVGYRTPSWEEDVARTYLENVESACRVGEAWGFRVAVLLQPIVYFSPQAGAQWNLPADFRPYAERQYDRMRAGFRELSARIAADRCRFDDLSRVCERGECSFQDMIHPTAETRAPIAGALFRVLEQAGYLPPASPVPPPAR